MAGNSQCRGAVRKPGTKRAPLSARAACAAAGWRARGDASGRQRTKHPAAKRAAVQRKIADAKQRRLKQGDEAEMVLGRNPVLECLRTGVPATALYVAVGADNDERLTESVALAADAGIAILEVPRPDLDRMSTNGLHQGLALQIPPYKYAHPDDLLARARAEAQPALLVALDNISDPRNLGAIVRSVAAFGGHGVVIPSVAVRRSPPLPGAPVRVPRHVFLSRVPRI